MACQCLFLYCLWKQGLVFFTHFRYFHVYFPCVSKRRTTLNKIFHDYPMIQGISPKRTFSSSYSSHHPILPGGRWWRSGRVAALLGGEDQRGARTVNGADTGEVMGIEMRKKYGQNGWEYEYMNMVHPQVISNVSWLQTSTNHFSSFLVDLGMVYYWAYYMSPSIFHHLGTSGGIAGHTNIIIVNNNYREFSYHTLSHPWGCHPTYIEGELLVQRRVITEGC